MKPSAKLIISLALPLLVGAIAGYFTSQSVAGWYTTLNPPSYNPPNWVFMPVWTTLYILMGISCYLIWKQPETIVRNTALQVYGVQLFLNFAWSFIFFYFHQIGIALIEISILWITILVMIIGFRRIKAVAGFMNIPYILWVSFALILNAGYYFLNR